MATRAEYEVLYPCEDCKFCGKCDKNSVVVDQKSRSCAKFKPAKGWLLNIYKRSCVQ